MKKYAKNGIVFKIFDFRPHGFLNLYKAMPEVKDIIKESADWFKEHLGDPNPEWKEFSFKTTAPVTTTPVLVPVTTTPVIVPIITTPMVVPVTTTPMVVPVTTTPVIVNTNVEIII